MTTIKIGNQEVELEAAKKLYDDAMSTPHDATAQEMSAFEALSTAIKEAEEVEGPFGRDECGWATFRGELTADASGRPLIFTNASSSANINRILSQHFVSIDVLREALNGSIGNGHMSLHRAVTALIEKGAPDA